MDVSKIKNCDKIVGIFKDGKLTPESTIAQGTAPHTVGFTDVLDGTTFAAGQTGWMTLIPTIYNADTLGIRPDLIGRPISSWTELLNPEFKGKASILDISSIGIPGSTVLFYLVLTALVILSILVSFGVGLLFSQSGLEVHWATSGLGAQLAWTLPFGLLIMFAVFNRFDRSYEEAARDLGATPWQVLRYVVIPIIGPSLIGGRFSVVTTPEVSVPILGDNVLAYGLGGALAKVRASGVPVLALEQAEARVADEIRRAIAEDGVSSVVLGCGGMAALRDRLQAETPVRLIDGVRAAVAIACSLFA